MRIFFLIGIFFSSLALPASEIVLQGAYYGYNLYVLNPIDGNGFCVKEILVNDIPTRDELRSSSFEIDFSQMNLRHGDAVTVVIRHSDACKPVIINPGAIQSKENFTFSYIKTDKNGKVLWGVRGELGDEPFVVEQYRWNKWLKIAEVNVQDTVKKYHYIADTYPHNGINTFRVFRKDAGGAPVYSKIAKFVSRAAEITLESAKVSDKLVFSADTFYEIFDYSGNFLMDGYGWEVDVSDLEKGKYWVNYDDKSVTFTKK